MKHELRAVCFFVPFSLVLRRSEGERKTLKCSDTKFYLLRLLRITLLCFSRFLAIKLVMWPEFVLWIMFDTTNVWDRWLWIMTINLPLSLQTTPPPIPFVSGDGLLENSKVCKSSLWWEKSRNDNDADYHSLLCFVFSFLFVCFFLPTFKMSSGSLLPRFIRTS